MNDGATAFLFIAFVVACIGWVRETWLRDEVIAERDELDRMLTESEAARLRLDAFAQRVGRSNLRLLPGDPDSKHLGGAS